MKKLAILFVALILGVNTYAQDNAVTKYFSKYQSDTSFTKVSVTSKMFSLFTELDVEEEAEKEAEIQEQLEESIDLEELDLEEEEVQEQAGQAGQGGQGCCEAD